MHCLSSTVRWINLQTRGFCLRRAKQEIYDSLQLQPYFTATSCFQLFIFHDEVNQRGLSAPRDSPVHFLKRVLDVAPWGLIVFTRPTMSGGDNTFQLGPMNKLESLHSQISAIVRPRRTREFKLFNRIDFFWNRAFPQCECDGGRSFLTA